VMKGKHSVRLTVAGLIDISAKVVVKSSEMLTVMCKATLEAAATRFAGSAKGAILTVVLPNLKESSCKLYRCQPRRHVPYSSHARRDGVSKGGGGCLGREQLR
jgi:hypothetical protein